MRKVMKMPAGIRLLALKRIDIEFPVVNDKFSG